MNPFPFFIVFQFANILKNVTFGFGILELDPDGSRPSDTSFERAKSINSFNVPFFILNLHILQ